MTKTLGFFAAVVAAMLLLGPFSAAVAGVREPVWAGRFYPADAQTLSRTLDELAGQCGPLPANLPDPSRLRALILPHAGYVYSGSTAAHGARLLRQARFDKVILMGPDHRVGFQGAAVSNADAFRTPLGEVPLHPDAVRLRKNPLFRPVPASDAQEHSLEVIVPFLQHFMGDFKLVPVVMGPADSAVYARTLKGLLDEKTLVVVSSDLSHYLGYESARAKDRQTIQAILDLDSGRLAAMDGAACGILPMLTLMELARNHRWRPVLLHASNSGDTAGDRNRVVGYAAVAFYEIEGGEGKKPMTQVHEDQGRQLVRLARTTIAEVLDRPVGDGLHTDDLTDPAFEKEQGTFVTLTIDGRLRGCIGNILPVGSIVEGVRRNALNAAFHDPRFSPLTADELDKIAIEVSLLTEPVPLAYADADDLIRRLRPAVDGVIIRQGRHSATFLPQVWDQLPHPESFLSHLCQKAGLASDAWREGLLEVETYQVRHFEEGD